MNNSADIAALPRQFLPGEFQITNWESLEPWFQQLLDRRQVMFLESSTARGRNGRDGA